MASVLPRISASGTVSWRVQGRDSERRMRQETFSTDVAATQFGQLVDAVGWDAAVRVRDARQNRTATVPTLAQFTAEYLDPASGLLTGITPATRADYQLMAARSFLPYLGELPLDALTKRDVARWIAWQESQPSARFPGRSISAKTIRNYHGLLSGILTSAVEEYKLDGNPARGTKLAAGERQGITFLTPTEFQTVMTFIPDYYRGLTLFLAATGMRWGEATALTWADLDLTAAVPTARVDKAWKRGVDGKPVLGPPKTRRSNRTVSLWPEVVRALGTPGDPIDLVFVGKYAGKRLWSERFWMSAWTPAVTAARDLQRCREAGVTPITKQPRVHDLRHSHASWLIAGGAPLPYVQDRLGHESITTTIDVYGHLMPAAHEQLAAVAASAMEGVLPLGLPPLQLVV